MVRAKFRVNRIERELRSMWNQEAGKYERSEVQTIVLLPVVDGSKENVEFFAATPSGEIKLATVNAEAAAQFELDAEYYVDFTFAVPDLGLPLYES